MLITFSEYKLCYKEFKGESTLLCGHQTCTSLRRGYFSGCILVESRFDAFYVLLHFSEQTF